MPLSADEVPTAVLEDVVRALQGDDTDVTVTVEGDDVEAVWRISNQESCTECETYYSFAFSEGHHRYCRLHASRDDIEAALSSAGVDVAVPSG